MHDGTGFAEAFLGLPGFRVTDVRETESELVVSVETMTREAFCSACGVRAEVHDRKRLEIRDLPCYGRPCRLVWSKRRFRCPEPECPARTWTETSEHVPERSVLTVRVGVEACRQVGELARPVSGLAEELGVCWWTIMAAVERHGRPLVDDPDRVGEVNALGVDETSFLKANRSHRTLYATGMVNLGAHQVIDMVEGNSAADLRRWCAEQESEWLSHIGVVATDLAESYRAGLSPHLEHVVRVADPFHVVRVANRCVDKVRRRVQNELTGHRGRKGDPLYKIRKLLLSGAERLDDKGHERMMLGLRLGDPNDELLGAWLAKESVRDVYLTDDPAEAALLLDKAIVGCLADEVSEIRSLGHTLERWREEILNHHRTGASNGPTEAMNLCVKRVKRAGNGFRTFSHYRLRVLLHTGGVTWPQRPSPPRIRTAPPHSFA